MSIIAKERGAICVTKRSKPIRANMADSGRCQAATSCPRKEPIRSLLSLCSTVCYGMFCLGHPYRGLTWHNPCRTRDRLGPALFGRSHRVDVPLRTSHIRHLKASALFLKVHTLQSQYPSSDDGFGCRFGLKKRGE